MDYNHQQRKQQKLQETRLARIKAVREEFKNQRMNLVSYYDEAKQQDQRLQKEYDDMVKQRTKQRDILKKLLMEEKWLEQTGASDVAVAQLQRNKIATQQKIMLQQELLAKTDERVEQIVRRQKVEQLAKLQKEEAEKQRIAAHENQMELRTKQCIEQQQEFERQRQIYYEQERAEQQTVEYKCRKAQGNPYTDILKEPQIPLQVTKKREFVGLEVLPEGEGCDGQAFAEAVTQVQNVKIREYPEFKPHKTIYQHKIGRLCQEGLEILDQIVKM